MVVIAILDSVPRRLLPGIAPQARLKRTDVSTWQNMYDLLKREVGAVCVNGRKLPGYMSVGELRDEWRTQAINFPPSSD